MGKALHVAGLENYDKPELYLPMPYKYYEAVIKKACEIAATIKDENAQERITGKYVDFIYSVMAQIDGEFISKSMAFRKAKTVIYFAPPLYGSGMVLTKYAQIVKINDFASDSTLDEKKPYIIRSYEVIPVTEEMKNWNCIFVLGGYVNDISKKIEYLRMFTVFLL